MKSDPERFFTWWFLFVALCVIAGWAFIIWGAIELGSALIDYLDRH